MLRTAFGFTGIFLLTLTLLAIGVQCRGQVVRVNTSDLMDIVSDMKSAAVTADRIASDGSKYCHWGVAPLNASDFDSAVSRFLLNNGSRVPDDISASKMWRLSFVADELINQLETGLHDCNRGMRLNRSIYDVAVAGKPVLSKLQDAKFKFVRQAYQQTDWQEWNHVKLLFPSKSDGARDGPGAPAVDVNEILGASLELRKAWESASKAVIQTDVTKECVKYGPSDKRNEPIELNKLIDRVSHTSPSGAYIRAADMWLVAITAEIQKLDVQHAHESCGYYAIWKKKAKKVADETNVSEQRLKAALTEFASLALRQTEWEERVFEKQALIQEQ
jgi:hypothetical protein